MALCHKTVERPYLKRLSSPLTKTSFKIEKTIVPCGVNTCVKAGLTLREEYRPKMFDNRVLKKTFGYRREK